MKTACVKRLLSILLFFALLFSITSSFSEMSDFKEAYQIISEYTMNFGKFDLQKIYNILLNEKEHPAYPYILFSSNNIINPLDQYVVYIGENERMQFLTLQCNDGEEIRELKMVIGIMGTQDSFIPVIILNGDDYDSKIAKVIFHADNDYEVTFSGNDTSTIDNRTISTLCPTLFDWTIDIIKHMAINEMSLSIDVKFQKGKQYSYSLVRKNSSDANQAQLFLDVMKECDFLDSECNIQSDVVVNFSDVEKTYAKQVKTTNLSDKKAKPYMEFGDRYGLTLTNNGSTGTDGKLPWFKVNVKNTDKNKTVDGFDLVYYGTSVYGDIIELDDDAKLLYQTVVKNIKPGAAYTTDKLYFYKSFQPKIIHAAIRRLHFSDGTLIEIPLRDLLFYEYDIDY